MSKPPKLILPPEYIYGLKVSIDAQSKTEKFHFGDYIWRFPYYLARWSWNGEVMYYFVAPKVKRINQPGLWTKGFDYVIDSAAMLLDIRNHIKTKIGK
jgi:hypothetical protein